MDEPSLFSSGDDPGPDPGLRGNRLQELPAVFRFPNRAGCHGHGFVDPVGLGQPPELGQDLKGRMHCLRRERPAIESTRAEANHFLFAVNHLERHVGTDPHHDHVEGVRADVDGRQINHSLHISPG